jgi:hypothetical protein
MLEKGNLLNILWSVMDATTVGADDLRFQQKYLRLSQRVLRRFDWYAIEYFDQLAGKLNFGFSGHMRNNARTAGIICIAVGLAVLMLVLANPTTSEFKRLISVGLAMAAAWTVIRGLIFLRKSSRSPKTPFE